MHGPKLMYMHERMAQAHLANSCASNTAAVSSLQGALMVVVTPSVAVTCRGWWGRGVLEGWGLWECWG